MGRWGGGDQVARGPGQDLILRQNIFNVQLGPGQGRGGPCQRRPTRAGCRHDLWAASQASALNWISLLNPAKHNYQP